jgi:hypothetical protein
MTLGIIDLIVTLIAMLSVVAPARGTYFKRFKWSLPQVRLLSGAPLQGRLLALTTNIKKDWKTLPGTNTSLLSKFVNYSPRETK